MTEIAVCNITRTILITLEHSRHSALENRRPLVLATITLNGLTFPLFLPSDVNTKDFERERCIEYPRLLFQG